MKANYLSLANLILLFSFLSTSCQSTLSPNSKAITTSPQHSVSTPPPTEKPVAKPQLIGSFGAMSSQPFFFWWSTDSSKLYYEMNGVWEYDLREGTMSKSQLKRPEPAPCPYLSETSEGVLLFKQECSPSNEKIIYYTIQNTYSSPFPDCSECADFTGLPIDLWLWKKGNVELVGQLVSCIQYYLWADNEQKLIAVGFDNRIRPSSPICDKAYYAWFIDLNSSQITPLLLKAEHSSNTFILDYSPDGNLLLYSEAKKLYLLNIQTKVVTDLQIPREVNEAWFFNRSQILVLFTSQNNGGSMGWGILDLDEDEYFEVLNESNAISEKVFTDPRVAPDGKWMAFTAYSPETDSFELWLLSLEKP